MVIPVGCYQEELIIHYVACNILQAVVIASKLNPEIIIKVGTHVM